MSTAQPPDEGDPGRYSGAQPLPAYEPGPFPSYPEAAGTAQTESRPPQPPSIRTAVRLMWAGAALSALTLVLTLVSLSSLKSHVREQLLKDDPTLSPSDVNAAYNAVVAAAVIIGVIAIALWLWMAWKNGQGRSWARIVATVLGVLNLLSSFFTIASGNALAISEILTVANLILAVVILVLLWRRESSDFYAASRRSVS
jgi:hypothetical protein